MNKKYEKKQLKLQLVKHQHLDQQTQKGGENITKVDSIKSLVVL